MKLIRRMTTAALSHVKDVDVDPTGVFKYILIKVSISPSGGKYEDKTIVRGYAECPYHTDINDKVIIELEKLKTNKAIEDFNSTVLGGGKIEHDPEAKSIKIYGESTGYGKADHKIAADILKKNFPNYQITFSDEKPS